MELHGLTSARALRSRIAVETGWTYKDIDRLTMRRAMDMYDAIRSHYIDRSRVVSVIAMLTYNANKKKEARALSDFDFNPFYNQTEKDEFINAVDIAVRKKGKRKQQEMLDNENGVIRKSV